VHDVDPRAAVRELAVAAVGLAPLLGQLADRLALPAQQRVRGLLRARLHVVELARGRPGLPAQHPHMPTPSAATERRSDQPPWPLA
jgi:hypothetical protein